MKGMEGEGFFRERQGGKWFLLYGEADLGAGLWYSSERHAGKEGLWNSRQGRRGNVTLARVEGSVL